MDSCKVGSRVTCTSCSQLYTLRDVQYGRGPKRPLLLACGHPMCEWCVQTALSGGKDSIACPVCSAVSAREHKEASIYADFPLSMFELGAVTARQWTQSTGDAQVTFVPPGASVRRFNKSRVVTEPLLTQQVVQELCEECVSRQCDWFCQQCELKYCNSCYSKVHKAKALMKHVKVPPPVGKVKLLETPLCDRHKDKPLEFYCKQCDCNICAHCFVDAHRPHEVVSLLEKNKECLETLEEAYEKGSKMLMQMLATQKKAEKLRAGAGRQQAASAAHYSRAEQDVARHFSRLHGLLQRREQALLAELGEARARHLDSLRGVSRLLADQLAEAREALHSARLAMLPANLALVDVAGVRARLAALLELPCHLVSSSPSGGPPDSLRFIADESFVEQLASHGQLELHTSDSHELRKSEDLPEDYIIEPVDESVLEDVCPPLTSSSRASSVSALGEEVAPPAEQHKSPPGQPPSGKVKIFALHERQDTTGPNNTHPVVNMALNPVNRKRARNILAGTSEAVVVTHVKDPGDFYVQLHSDQNKISSLAITCKKLAASSTIPTEVKPGEVYLVCYKADKNWYRVRAVTVIPAPDDQSEQHVLVQYIDFGNSEKVPMSSLRVAPKPLLQTAFLAINCGLHGIHPAGDKWSSESIKLFAQMVNGSVVLMVVLNYAADKYEIDLCRMPTGGEDVPSSVLDAMVFLGLAHYFNNVQRQSRQLTTRPDPFYNKPGLKHGDIVDVTISHIENPSSFYVQKVDQSYVLMNDMMEKLGEEYALIGNRGLVYTPYLNMPCAALYSLDKKWYRAKVVDLPGNRLVQVEYVDFGNKELVSWNKIRKLGEVFMQLPAQAIRCALNDVAPPPEMGGKWTAKASHFLQQRTVSQISRMFVDSAAADVLKVTLYEVKPNVDICINALMVREGLARSTGVSSSLVEFHKSVDDIQNMKLKIPLSSKGSMGKNASGGRKRPSKPPPVTESPVDDDADEGDDEGTEEEDRGPLKVEVKVLSVVNPSQLYVSIVSQQKAINSMMEEMQEFYQQCPKSDKVWAVGDHCAAYVTDKKLWFRAVILELLGGDNAKVFLKDTADCVLVEVSYLRELSNLFAQLHDGAVRCHLAGIKPAGSSSTWSILATEFLTTLVSHDNPFSITKKGEMENDSLPVELLIKEVVEEGPLSPTVEEWRAINNKLVEQGLAFTIRNSASLSGGQHLLKTLDKNPQSDGIAVTQWLTTQKSGRSAGPRKSPKKPQTDSVADRDTMIMEKTAKQEVQIGKKKPDLSDSMLAHASDADSDDTSDIQDKDSSPPIFDSWLPANSLPSYEIWVVPTYVDMNCKIYFHHSQQEDTLTVISNGLNSRFANSKPKPCDSYWSPGQTCVALYHSDKKWYRGKVISIKEDMTVEVMFVDYGNVETCKASELRKDVCLTHIPMQCHSAKVYGIAPLSDDGLWPIKTLDFIHLTVVEKLCFVKLRTSTTGELLMMSLIGPGNLDLYQLLVNMRYCVLTYASEGADSDGSDAVYIEAQEDVVMETVVTAEERQSEVACSEAGGTAVAVTESTAAVDTRGDDMPVMEEARLPGDKSEAGGVGPSEAEDCVASEDSCGEEVERVGGGDVVTTAVEAGEKTVSGECATSDGIDESESKLGRKPQSLMDWYDIITEEENKMNGSGSEFEDGDDRVAYHAMELPDLDKFLVEVTAMLSINEVVLQLLKTETVELKEMKTQFEELTRILQIEAQEQAVLNIPFIGQPCCACYTEDRQWYRAMIVDIFDDLQAKIVYVDYGNTEIVTAHSLHEMKPEWLELPVQGVQARLWRVVEAPEQDHPAVIRRLAGCLFQPPVIAHIKSRSPLMVQILCNKTLEPVYQSLFDDGLLMVDKSE
ncbi:RING finger protein 17 isoform X2 [Bacillus rossius redtenbacheri]|uniref:RING finger protein 17 isoform X2 n=1 Tax=Bacillus rossius redtenbacheri TaxID=93214 RepID=UPI002FDCA74D